MHARHGSAALLLLCIGAVHAGHIQPDVYPDINMHTISKITGYPISEGYQT